MRIKASTSFPHPVLAESTADYEDRKFRLNLAVQESASIGQVILDGSLELDDRFVQELITSGEATAGLMITCLDTYLDHFEKRNLGEISVDLSGGQVRGRVYVRGVVVAVQNGVRLKSDAISAEFLPESRIVDAGDLIALSEEQVFEAGLEKLAPLESIFRLKLQEDVPAGHFMLDLESEAIDILVGPSLHHFLSLLRGQPMKDILLSALYLPVVMSVLEAMSDEGYADKRWHSVMTARCSAEGIDAKQGELARSAQRLLDAPLGALQKVLERVSE